MRWSLLAASALLAACLWVPSQAAPPNPEPDVSAGSGETITFDQYREWRLHNIQERQTALAKRLAAKDLTADQRNRLDQQKSYYDWLAGMPNDERDRRFRERFDLIDANHDGKIDTAERAAWREKQRDRYRQHAAGDGARP